LFIVLRGGRQNLVGLEVLLEIVVVVVVIIIIERYSIYPFGLETVVIVVYGCYT